ncbi:uncharacterized protein [Triticum aestivum]|uniref:uncharacterized protein n=1 Tax=Triticum aestivum TaxID=4565 RepID=UPI001D00D202|nr:uncharacterized protein LOC123157984 [Triticum aestivum]
MLLSAVSRSVAAGFFSETLGVLKAGSYQEGECAAFALSDAIGCRIGEGFVWIRSLSGREGERGSGARRRNVMKALQRVPAFCQPLPKWLHPIRPSEQGERSSPIHLHKTLLVVLLRAQAHNRVWQEDSTASARGFLERPSARAMGNSCVTGACSKGSNGSGTTFKWRIDGFSSLLDKDEGWTNSSVFVIKGLNWYLMLNPRDRKSGDQNEYVTLKLVLTKVSERSHMVAETTFKFLIYDQLYGKHHEEHQGTLAPWSSPLRFATSRLLD